MNDYTTAADTINFSFVVCEFENWHSRLQNTIITIKIANTLITIQIGSIVQNGWFKALFPTSVCKDDLQLWVSLFYD